MRSNNKRNGLAKGLHEEKRLSFHDNRPARENARVGASQCCVDSKCLPDYWFFQVHFKQFHTCQWHLANRGSMCLQEAGWFPLKTTPIRVKTDCIRSSLTSDPKDTSTACPLMSKRRHEACARPSCTCACARSLAVL